MDLTPIPYVDLARQHASIKGELLAAIAEVLDSGQFILGEQVEEFETRFAQLCGTRYAVGVNSGTDALILALQSLGIGSGDEVITVPNSFIATTSCIKLVGAHPVFVDVGPDYNLDPSRLQAAITPRTRAILPVHLTGHPCDMDPILKVAREHGLHVVEDSAQAVLAEYKGRRVGSFGILGCFSLHPLKTLNACGDAGVVTTNDAQLYEELRTRRNIGMRTRDEWLLWSHNSRLDTMQAAVLLVKLRYLEQWTLRRQENVAFYRRQLAGISQIRFPPSPPPYCKAVYQTFIIQAERRDELRAYLTANGIHTAVHYATPIHMTRVGAELGLPPGSFPVAERQARHIVSLPSYPELTQEQLERICEVIRAFYAGYPTHEVHDARSLVLPGPAVR